MGPECATNPQHQLQHERDCNICFRISCRRRALGCPWEGRSTGPRMPCFPFLIPTDIKLRCYLLCPLHLLPRSRLSFHTRFCWASRQPLDQTCALAEPEWIGACGCGLF